MHIASDVVFAYGTLLLPKKKLAAQQGQLGYDRSPLTVGKKVVARLANLPIGLLRLPGFPSQSPAIWRESSRSKKELKPYPSLQDRGLVSMSDAEVLNPHLHLSRCSAFDSENLLRAGRRLVGGDQARRVLGNFFCNGISHRVTPPRLTGSSSKFSGQIIELGVAYPSAGEREGMSGKRFSALLMVGCLARFPIPPIAQGCRSATLTGALLNDRIRPLGKPRCIIAENGPPVAVCIERRGMPHTYSIVLAHAPNRNRRRMGWRSELPRRWKCPLANYYLTFPMAPSKTVLIQVATARNHVPHTVTGIPPASAMTGRPDLLSGNAAAAWSQDPHPIDPSVRLSNAIRNIPNARNAIIASYEKGPWPLAQIVTYLVEAEYFHRRAPLSK